MLADGGLAHCPMALNQYYNIGERLLFAYIVVCVAWVCLSR